MIRLKISVTFNLEEDLMDGFGVKDKPCLDLKILVAFNLVIANINLCPMTGSWP
jgi:hypothetical protein